MICQTQTKTNAAKCNRKQGVGLVFERTDTRQWAVCLCGFVAVGLGDARGKQRRDSMFCPVRAAASRRQRTRPTRGREQAPEDTERWRDGSDARAAPIRLPANAAEARARATRERAPRRVVAFARECEADRSPPPEVPEPVTAVTAKGPTPTALDAANKRAMDLRRGRRNACPFCKFAKTQAFARETVTHPTRQRENVAAKNAKRYTRQFCKNSLNLRPKGLRRQRNASPKFHVFAVTTPRPQQRFRNGPRASRRYGGALTF